LIKLKMIKTKRLTLSEFTINDWLFIIELLNTAGWLQYIGDRNVHIEEQAKAYLANGPIKSYADFGFGLMKAQLTTTGQSIGMCGLLKRETLPHPDIGFAFLPEFASQGYAFEAASAVVQHTQASVIQEILAIVQPDNANSIRLLKKLQFQFVKDFSFQDKAEVLALYRLLT
jgi:[ribosomal protein S5]-alanine N-acetyltransferase